MCPNDYAIDYIRNQMTIQLTMYRTDRQKFKMAAIVDDDFFL